MKMMSIKHKLKRVAELIPPSIGKSLQYMPYSLRLGKKYFDYKHKIDKELSADVINSDQYFESLKRILRFSYDNIPFYKAFYNNHGFDVTSVNTINDISSIPVVKKSDLQQYPVAKRSFSTNCMVKENTGGTSGKPLDFYLDKHAYAREWAHIHTIWDKLGYSKHDLKLTIRGRNIGNSAYKYNFNQNEYIINAYAHVNDYADAVLALCLDEKIGFIHGYPSAIFYFLKEVEINKPEIIAKLRETLKGVLFGSEYPQPKFRTYIETLLGVPAISWYGHTEMVVLAYEKNEPFVYEPFLTYGLTEAVKQEDGTFHLVGTSFDNNATPLIRYDTEDIIEPLAFDGPFLKSFRIAQGRNSDSVIDRKGKIISLTGLVFGRHHRVFDYADFVQVFQPIQGKVIFYVTSNSTLPDIESLFDFENVDLSFSVKQISQPIRTSTGKTPLLVNSRQK